MSYSIKYTDFINNGAVVVNDSDLNDYDTSLSFPGRNYRGYGIAVAENFLHLLENFANSSEPENPVEGQLWYDTTTQELKVCDGSFNFKSAGSVRKGANTPEVGVLGDLWVDTDNQQLYLFNGSSWVLVGPTFSSGLRTGVVAETLLDSNDITRVVLKTYIEDEIVSIYSTETFTPKVGVQGFGIIKSGLNLSIKDFNGDTVIDTKYWGTAEKAENLIVGNNVVASNNFLRRDTSNITNFGFTVKNDVGISTGNESQLRLSVDSGQVGNIYHATPDSAFDIRINYNGELTTLLRADSNGNIGVGINNLAPTYTLDVLGSFRTTGVTLIQSLEDTTNDVTGALQVAGGVNIQKNLIVRGDSTLTGHLTVGDAQSTSPVAIQPLSNNQYDIGTSTNKFSRIYSTHFYGNIVGDVVGNITGNINGKATSLNSPTIFNMEGDVTAPQFTFDGAAGGFTKTFVTEINPDFVNTKEELLNVNGSDELLIYRPGTGLRKMFRGTFFQEVATVPIGTILPFAGEIVPTGYLLCDGSEKQRAIYPELFSVIGYTYGAPAFLQGTATFRLPDLRGRFPIGRNTMDNGDQIPTNTGLIDSNTQALSGANASTAGILGNTNGNDEISLAVANIPNHNHDFVGDNGTEFYATNNTSGIPDDTGAFVGNGPDAVNQGQYINTTGDMIGFTTPVTPIDIMNPYMTINYIIFTGKFS